MYWEYPGFVAVAAFFMVLQQMFLYYRYLKAGPRSYERNSRSNFFYYITIIMLFFMLCSLGGGWFFVQYWEGKAKQQMKYIMDGVAPTFAYELKRMGHAAINMETSEDDPAYLEMLNTMVGWMKVNPRIQSIYTFRKNPQGEVVFILGPETDYNRDGVIEGDEEKRVGIGTGYAEVLPEMEAAFRGHYAIQEEPTKDKWGYSISAFMPMSGEGSDMPEAILGIDFDGTNWNEVLQLERLKAIGMILGFLGLINIFYLIFCHYWFDIQKNRQQELDLEIANLERLNLIGEIAAGIGHEVRNPMTTVRGFLQLFQRKQEFAPQRGNIDLMIEELDRANAIISEFLSLAKNRRVDLVSCSLNEVLRIMQPILHSEALLTGHNLILNMGTAPSFPMDTNEIRQLILNLFRNGLEAMPKRGTITINTYMQGGQACLEISDEGTGIARHVFEKMGTPFLTTKESGTGLGLSVCFRIAERHKAKIEAATGSSGTTFTVRFPLA